MNEFVHPYANYYQDICMVSRMYNFSILSIFDAFVIVNYLRSCCFIKFSNSLSDIFFFASIAMAASFPTTYLKSGLSDMTASTITLATSDGGVVFSIIFLNACKIVSVSCLYGE